MATEVEGIVQSTGEIRTHYVDFIHDLPSGVTVASAVAVHVPPSGAASIPIVGAVVDGHIVPVTLGVQTVTGPHQLIVTATLSDAQKSVLKIGLNVVWELVDADMVVLVSRLRRMVSEPGNGAYPDWVLVEYIERFPLEDSTGQEPYELVDGEYENNADWMPTYDLNSAAAEVWDEKAAAAAANFDFTADGGTYHRSQVHKAYEGRARYYRSRRAITSITQRPEPLGDDTEEEA